MPDTTPAKLGNLPLDISEHEVTIKPKPSAEAERRRLRREDITFYAVLAGLGASWLIAAYYSFLVDVTATNVDLKSWARTVFTSILSGFIGYAFAKK